MTLAQDPGAPLPEDGVVVGRPRTYSVEQAAALLGVSKSSAYRHIDDPAFPVPVIRIGRTIRIPMGPLDQLLASGGVPVQLDAHPPAPPVGVPS